MQNASSKHETVQNASSKHETVEPFLSPELVSYVAVSSAVELAGSTRSRGGGPAILAQHNTQILKMIEN